MTIGYLDSSRLDDIADAIRAKAGTSESLAVGDMPDAIAAIPTGGGGDLSDVIYKLLQGGTPYPPIVDVDTTTLSRANTTGITNLRSSALANASYLGPYKAVFPDVTTIKDNAFAGSPIKEVTFEKTVTLSGSSQFRGCSKLERVNAPNGLALSGQQMFDYCTKLQSIPAKVPELYTTIGMYAFRGCSGLQAIDIPNGVTSIDQYAFMNCTAATSLSIPSTLTSISAYCFQNCSSLTEVEIPATVMSLGSQAFERCSGLQKITLKCGGNYPDRLTRYCGNLRTIDWTPNSSATYVNGTDSMSSAPFIGCTALTAWIIRSDTPPSLRGTYLTDTQGQVPSADFKIYVPDASVADYQAATNWSVFANHIKPLSEYVAS